MAIEPLVASSPSVILDGQARRIFLKQLRKFEMAFCELMKESTDFTLKFEVHGNKGEVLHCRIYRDEIDRPRGVEKRIDDKR